MKKYCYVGHWEVVLENYAVVYEEDDEESGGQLG